MPVVNGLVMAEADLVLPEDPPGGPRASSKCFLCGGEALIRPVKTPCCQTLQCQPCASAKMILADGGTVTCWGDGCEGNTIELHQLLPVAEPQHAPELALADIAAPPSPPPAKRLCRPRKPCMLCGESSHPTKHCPTLVCKFCSGPGHAERHCPNKPRQQPDPCARERSEDAPGNIQQNGHTTSSDTMHESPSPCKGTVVKESRDPSATNNNQEPKLPVVQEPAPEMPSENDLPNNQTETEELSNDNLPESHDNNEVEILNDSTVSASSESDYKMIKKLVKKLKKKKKAKKRRKKEKQMMKAEETLSKDADPSLTSTQPSSPSESRSQSQGAQPKSSQIRVSSPVSEPQSVPRKELQQQSKKKNRPVPIVWEEPEPEPGGPFIFFEVYSVFFHGSESVAQIGAVAIDGDTVRTFFRPCLIPKSSSKIKHGCRFLCTESPV